MIFEIIKMHESLPKNKKIRVILSADDWEIGITTNDKLSITSTNALKISRENGNRTIVNPDQIVVVCMAKREHYSLGGIK